METEKDICLKKDQGDWHERDTHGVEAFAQKSSAFLNAYAEIRELGETVLMRLTQANDMYLRLRTWDGVLNNVWVTQCWATNFLMFIDECCRQGVPANVFESTAAAIKHELHRDLDREITELQYKKWR